jgi:hypothetical protein
MKAAKIAFLMSMFVFASVLYASAQGTPPPQGGAVDAPIDGGAVALLVAASVYGHKKLSSKTKQQELPAA